MHYSVHVGSQVREIEVDEAAAPGVYAVTIDGRSVTVTARRSGDGSLVMTLDGRTVETYVVRARGGTEATVCVGGHAVAVTCRTGMEEQLAKAREASGEAHESHVRTSMPGKVVDIKVKPGDEVAAGQRLLVLEAMKMENEIVAKGAAKVKAVHVKVGAAVESGALLIELEKAGA
jgi:3-methylcrotonyl-CoA carboxylase alpha subunit